MEYQATSEIDHCYLAYADRPPDRRKQNALSVPDSRVHAVAEASNPRFPAGANYLPEHLPLQTRRKLCGW
jgi:hypothetical protein